jgi:hypothetical protein
MIYRGPSFLRSYDSAPRPPLPLYPRAATHRKMKKRDMLLTGEGEGGGCGAESYDDRKAWTSINNSILSAFFYVVAVGHIAGKVEECSQ